MRCMKLSTRHGALAGLLKIEHTRRYPSHPPLATGALVAKQPGTACWRMDLNMQAAANGRRYSRLS